MTAVCSTAAMLELLSFGPSLEGPKLVLAADRHDRHLPRARIRHGHLQLAVFLEERDVARFRPAGRQIENRPFPGDGIVLCDLVRAPQISPDVVPAVDCNLIGL